MSLAILLRAAAAAVLTLLIAPVAVSAHQEVNAGNYVIEYGWTNEPALVNQPNAVVVNISAAQASGSAPSGSISLLAPTDNANVDGDKVDVNVKVAGVDAGAADSMHWHLYVDDQVLAMAPLSQTTVTVSGLKDGMHTVKAALASVDHGDVGQPVQATIMVSGSSSTTDPTAENVQLLPAAGNTGGQADFTVDVSNLKIEVDYGGQTKTLALQPLPDGQAGQYVAPFVPTRAGQYTVKLTGKISGSAGDSDVNLSVTPEEVAALDAYAFPALAAGDSGGGSFGLTGWLALGGLIAGLVGIALGALALTRKK